MAEIDWLELWRDLATTMRERSGEWASRYESHARRKIPEKPDPLLDFVLRNLSPQSTLLDIGAGGGRWALPIARIARSVTAVEPSATMREILEQNIAAAKLDNIRIVPALWQEAGVEAHDVVISAHAMNSSPDFAGFVRKMERNARERCYIVLHLPPADGIIGELSLSIYERRFDNPNAAIAYNALYDMGIYANVLVEEDIIRWEDATIEEAFTRAKRHLRLESTVVHDKLIRDTLNRHLTLENGRYIWPDGMRSALLWWRPAR